MTEDSSRYFDASRTRSVAGAAVSQLRAHWHVVLALIVTVAILQTMAFGLVGIDAIGSDRVDASVASIAVLVAAEPEASAAEVDALGPLIRAVPGVSDATLRSKDDALKAIVASGLPPPDGRNPLPDVWIVRLRPALVGNGATVSTVLQEKRALLASMPRVASVSTDERWLATIDRGIGRWRTGWPVALSVGLAVLALAAAGVAYLAGRGLRTSREPDKQSRVRVLAFAAGLVGTIIALCAYASAWLLIDWAVEVALGLAPWPFAQLLATRPWSASSVVGATMLILAAGFVAGGRDSK